MKANELMIGDWVQCTYWHNPHILQVYELKRLGDDELKIVVVEDALPLVFQEVYIEPIPITAEILEKNGWNNNALSTNFTLKGYDWSIKIEYLNEKWAIEIRNTLTQKDSYGRNDMIAFYRDWVKDIYVHELQHALKLCGIDKEIVL